MDSQLALRPVSAKKDCGGSFGGKIAAAAPKDRSGLTNASFRVYYSLRAGAVPFQWESAPGTPKNTAAVSPAETAPGEAEALPPISPPPSYQASSTQVNATRSRARSTTSSSSWPAGGVLRALRGVLGRRKSRRRSPGRPASDL